VQERPPNYDDLVDALREHPEWRRELRELLDDDGPKPPAPGRARVPRWLSTLGMGVLAGALAAAVVAFVLVSENGDERDPSGIVGAVTPDVDAGGGPAGSPTGSAPAAATTADAAVAQAPAASVEATSSPEPTTPTSTPAPATPGVVAEPAGGNAAAPQPAAPSVTAATPSTTPQAAGPPRYTFAGFEGACAPISAVLDIEEVNRPLTIAGTWTRSGGTTVITVAPVQLSPQPAGSIVTVRFPTVAPLTPGLYTFAATVDGTVVASESTEISC
jgi:hypothetical protein